MKRIFEQGQRIYYGGDMANCEDFGTVTEVIRDPKWGTYYTITLDDGRVMKGIYPTLFSEEYKGHGGTKFVTEEEYERWRKDRLAESMAATKRVMDKGKAA